MVDFRVSVVLPAAGIGSRMGFDIPKQVHKLTVFVVEYVICDVYYCNTYVSIIED
jgi:2-C-methyl-D-erythritol 4-phosphate cytidylyltransferase